MMKMIKYVWVAFLMALMVPFLQAQTIELQEGKPVTKNYVLRCADNPKKDTMPISVTFSYNEKNQVITLELTPQFRNYDLLWFPPQDFSNIDDVKLFTEQHLGDQKYKFKYTRQFKTSVENYGEVKSAFACSNCEWVKPANWSKLKPQDLHELCFCQKNKKKQVDFKVTNPNELVQITLKSLVPVKVENTKSGIQKYEYQFVAQHIRIDISCKAKPEPCESATNKALADSVATLQEQVDANYKRLQQCQEPKSHQECMDILEKINKEYVPRFNLDTDIYNNTIDLGNEDSVCRSIGTQLEQLRNKIRNAQDYVCPAELKPCELTSNILLSDRITTLQGQVRQAYGKLLEWKEQKNGKECRAEQKQIEEVYREQYLGYYLDFREQDTVCDEIEGKLQQLNDTLDAALGFACPAIPQAKTSTPIVVERKPEPQKTKNSSEIAKKIKKEANRLNDIVSATQSDSNRRKNKRNGEQLIKEVDELIGSLSDADKSEKEIANVIKFYNKVKETFELQNQ